MVKPARKPPRAVSGQPLATPEQVALIGSLLKKVRLPDGTVDKWFAKAGVERWEEMPRDVCDKVIEFVRNRTPTNRPAKELPVADRAGTVRIDADEDGQTSFRFEAQPPVGNDVELGRFEQQLLIDKHRLDEVLVEQPQVFYSVTDRHAEAVSRRDQAKDRLETIEAELTLDYKAEAREHDEKLTEGDCKARVQASDKRKKAFDRWVAAEREVNRWKALSEAFRQRSKMIEELVELHRMSYFAKNSVDGAAREQRRAGYEDGRRELAEARERR